MNSLKEGPLLVSRESEAALLGALIMRQEAIDEVREIIAVDDLFSPQLKTVFKALLRMHDAGQTVDLVQVVADLRELGELESVGGAHFVAQLCEEVPNIDRAKDYAKSVRKFSQKRMVLEAHREIGIAIRSGQIVNGELERFVKAVKEQDDTTQRRKQNEPQSLAALRGRAAELSAQELIPTEIKGLDAALGGGYRSGWLVITGAFTSGGKTTLCVRESIQKASAGHPVLYITTELGAVEVAHRIDAALSPQVPDLPIHVWDASPDLSQVVGTIERWVQPLDGGKCPVVLVDYIQRVRVTGQQSREREVAFVAEELQGLARRLGILIIAPAQLNRDSQKNEKPAIHHLRESGLLEQTADVVLLIAKTGDDRMRIAVAKNRWGRSGDEIELSVDYARAWIGELSPCQVYANLQKAVIEYLQENGNPSKMRDMCQSISWNGKRPKREEILEAERHVGGFAVRGTEIVLL